MQLLLDAGADPNTRHTDAARRISRASAVQFAASNGSVEILRLLAKAGADLNAADATGLTPLISAAFMGHTGVVDAPLEAGAALEERDKDGYTALIFASNGGKAAVAQQLLGAGAAANARARDGSTPIMFAAQQPSTTASASCVPPAQIESRRAARSVGDRSGPSEWSQEHGAVALHLSMNVRPGSGLFAHLKGRLYVGTDRFGGPTTCARFRRNRRRAKETVDNEHSSNDNCSRSEQES
jgi:ankyrin repeat protein